MTDSIPVLIVGAGPTGLLMACELARMGISFRIIEKKPELTQGSNATWIHPSTLELFDHIGLADTFIKNGHICNAVHLHIKGKDLDSISLDQIDSIYPFILMLPQRQTEKILTEHLEKLNCKVERSTELTAVTQENGQVKATIRNAANQIETITSQWLIACDGANSKVRASCGIFFPGEDISEQFMVADANMDSYITKNEIHAFFDKETVCGVFPMGEKDFRINANLHQGAPRRLFIDKEVEEIITDRTYGAYNVRSVSWISPFWIHSRVVDQMRHGAIFLAGDAAHIHSPVSGQGMNSGIQDAYNLAWKLSAVIKGEAKKTLLESYHTERHPVVKRIVNQTERFTRMALFDKSFLTKLRKFNDRVARTTTTFSRKFLMELTQLDTHYQDSPVIDYLDRINNQSIKPGEHAPDVQLGSMTTLYRFLRNTHHNVLLFCGLKHDIKRIEKMKELQHWFHKRHRDRFTTHIISLEKLDDVNHVIVDNEGRIHDRYHIKTPAIYILRPDNFIAYCSKRFSHGDIERFLQHYMEN